MFSIALLALGLLPQALGCADHSNYLAPQHSKRQAGTTTNSGPRVQTYWQYEASFNWGRLSPDYELCQSGSQQSPIGISLLQGLSQRHTPSFNGYEGNYTGEYYNWGYGPAFTFYHPEGDYSGLPSMTFDDETVYCTGWHIHAPADHSVSADRSKAELHYVHYDSNGTSRAVVAIRLDPGKEDSAFFAQLPQPAVHFNDTTKIQDLDINPYQAIREVSDFEEFWTYKGSLTSPPCHEGIQWFLARTILFTSVNQMQDILRASTFSARSEQEVWLHEVNV